MLFFFLIFSASAHAQLFVKISPKGTEGVETAYLHEVQEFELTVFNSSQAGMENLFVQVSVDPALKILKGFEEKEAIEFKLEAVEAGEKITEIIPVKPVLFNSKENYISVSYGLGELTHVESTYLLLKESPLKVEAVLEKTALNLGESGSLKVDLRNLSGEELRNISLSLSAPEGIHSESEPLQFETLSPGQFFGAKEFAFTPSPSKKGKYRIALETRFEDSEGQHFIEKSFEVDIANRDITLMIIVGVIFVLIVLSFIVSRPKKMLQSPASHPLKKEVKGTLPEEGEPQA